MKRGNKKGLSEVIVSLLMIFLVLIAVGIIWAVVSGILKSGSEDISISGLTLNMEITEVIYDYSSNSDLNVKVKRNPGEGKVVGLTFIFEGDDFTKEVDKSEVLNELDEKVFTFNIYKDFDLFSGINATKISIIPTLISDSGKEKKGNIADEVVLSCSDSDGLDYSTKGTVTTPFGRYEDYCEGTVLQEFSCKDYIVIIEMPHYCLPFSCIDGACS